MYKKILVPLDGSGLAECVFEHVSTVAAGCSVPEVDLLYVAERTPSPYTGMAFGDASFRDLPNDVRDEGVRREVAWGNEYLAKIAADFKKQGIEARTVVLQGNPADKILDYATKNGVDLIIMSSHGRSGPARWAYGSTSERIVRHSAVPTMMVRPAGCAVAA